MPVLPPITGEGRPSATVSTPTSMPPITGQGETTAIVASRAHVSLPAIQGQSVLRGFVRAKVLASLPPIQSEGRLSADFIGKAVISLPPITSEGRVSGNIRADSWPPTLTESKNIALDRRPYAITYDGLISFDMGPIALSDASAGLYARAWRIRVDGNDVYISGASPDNDAWEEESLLFSYTGGVGTSFDLTFDQNGRPFVCWEQGGSVWIYYYDPTLPGMTTREVCSGRTPRARLDIRHPVFTSYSDIMLFYLNDSADQAEYRAQRDRYDTAYATGLINTANKYLELLAMGRNNRLYLWYSLYDPGDKLWALCCWHSAPYPVFVSESLSAAGDSVREGKKKRISQAIGEIELTGDNVLSAGTRSVMKDVSASVGDESAALVGDSVLNAETVYISPYEEVSLYEDPEVMATGDSVLSGNSRTSIIVEDMDNEEVALTGDSVQSATKT